MLSSVSRLRVRASQREWEYSWIRGSYYEKIRRVFEVVVLWASSSSHQNRIYKFKVEMSKKNSFFKYIRPVFRLNSSLCFMLCANQSLWFCVYEGIKDQIDLVFGPVTLCSAASKGEEACCTWCTSRIFYLTKCKNEFKFKMQSNYRKRMCQVHNETLFIFMCVLTLTKTWIIGLIVHC